MAGQCRSSLSEVELQRHFLKPVQDDIRKNIEDKKRRFFIDQDCYQKCYLTSDADICEAWKSTDITNFLTFYNMPMSITRELTDSQLSDDGRRTRLISMGGKYGYHVMYVAMKLDKMVTKLHKEALEKLVDTAIQLNHDIPHELGIVVGNSMPLELHEPDISEPPIEGGEVETNDAGPSMVISKQQNPSVKQYGAIKKPEEPMHKAAADISSASIGSCASGYATVAQEECQGTTGEQRPQTMTATKGATATTGGSNQTNSGSSALDSGYDTSIKTKTSRIMD